MTHNKDIEYVNWVNLAHEIKKELSSDENPINCSKVDGLCYEFFFSYPKGQKPRAVLESLGQVTVVTTWDDNWKPKAWALLLPDGKGWFYYRGNPLHDTSVS